MKTREGAKQETLTNRTSLCCGWAVFISFCSSLDVITGTFGNFSFKKPITSLRAIAANRVNVVKGTHV